jgi:hypothetical protein
VLAQRDGQGTFASISYPFFMTFDSFANLYVSEWGSRKILKVNSTGYVSTIAGSLNQYWYSQGFLVPVPSGLAIHPSGDLYIAETYNHMIRRLLKAAEA